MMNGSERLSGEGERCAIFCDSLISSFVANERDLFDRELKTHDEIRFGISDIFFNYALFGDKISV